MRARAVGGSVIALIGRLDRAAGNRRERGRTVTVRWLGATVLVALALGGVFVGQALTAGPGGWDHLGDAGTPGSDSLNGNVNVLNGDTPGLLLVGGEFTDAGGNAAADRIASLERQRMEPGRLR